MSIVHPVVAVAVYRVAILLTLIEARHGLNTIRRPVPCGITWGVDFCMGTFLSCWAVRSAVII